MADPASKIDEKTEKTQTTAGGAESRKVSSPVGSGSGVNIDPTYILNRAKAVLTNPKGVWDEIQQEALSPKDVYIKYVLVLAALPAIATYIGMVVFGQSIPFTNMTYRWPIFGGLVTTIVTYITSLLTIPIGAFIVQKLGPSFGAKPTFEDGIRLFAFSLTAGYVGGILGIIPMLSVLSILFSIYALYTMYQGFVPMTGVAQDRKIGYFASTLVLGVISMIVLSLILSIFSPVGFNPSPGEFAIDNSEGTSDGAAKIKLPGGISIDPAEFEKSMKQLENMVPQENRGR